MILLEAYKARRMGLISDESLFNSSLGKKFKAYDEFNKWDEEWETGAINSAGNNSNNSNMVRSKNYIIVIPDTTYYFNLKNTGTIHFYDADKTHIVYSGTGASDNGIAPAKGLFVTPSDCRFVRFRTSSAYGGTYKNNICINISKTKGSPKNGDYVPYKG